MTDPVLFYFWAHGTEQKEQLETRTLDEILERSDVLFYECVMPDVHYVQEVENEWNQYISSGKIGRQVQYSLDHPDERIVELTLAKKLKDTGKRWVFEGAQLSLDLSLINKVNPYFWLGNSEEGFNTFCKHTKEFATFQDRRNKNAAQAILRLQGRVGVLFGFGHYQIASLVAEHRPVEVHKSVEFEETYELQACRYFLQHKTVSHELYVRSMLERFFESFFKSQGASFENRNRLARSFTDAFSVAQIDELREYVCLNLKGNDMRQLAYYVRRYARAHNLPQLHALR